MKENEFDLDFDFEKEYGFDLPKEDDKKKVDEDFDLKDDRTDTYYKIVKDPNEIREGIKIVKGEYVSKSDLEFINTKYPDMKQLTDNSLKNYNKIIKELKLCKSYEEIEKVLTKFSKVTLAIFSIGLKTKLIVII